jgi:hypothetical protein
MENESDFEEGGEIPETVALTAKGSSEVLCMSDPKVGLTSEQEEAALAKYGPNEIPVSVIQKLFVREFI